MIQRILSTSVGIASLIAVTATVNAAILAFTNNSNSPSAVDLPITHSGTNDPITEGWTLYNPSPNFAIVGPISNDRGSGVDAWQVEDLGSNTWQLISYGIVPSPEQVAQASRDGWSFAMKLRILGTNYLSDEDFARYGCAPGFGYTDGSKHWSVWMDRTSTDDLIVAAYYRPDLVQHIKGAGSCYHTCEMRYDPTTHSATFRLDGPESAQRMLFAVNPRNSTVWSNCLDV